jgi:hypothetical protein
MSGLVLATACQERPLSPVDPSAAGPGDASLVHEVGLKWSPYVGVHIDGRAVDAYRDALVSLRRAGRLRGVRVEISQANQNPTDAVIKTLGGLGLELLALVGNEYLFEPRVEAEIDRLFSAYPEIRYFQIGNEVTTILSGVTMTIEEYMEVFRRVYDHVQTRHPGRAILLTDSTFGFFGARELETMARLGLADMDPDKVIIAVNAYDPASTDQYRGVLGGPLRRYRVWVTESGVSDPSLQVAFVLEKYPLLQDYLRAERIYWYTLWGGDSGAHTDFSLIKYPMNYPQYWRSPLFELLTK